MILNHKGTKCLRAFVVKFAYDIRGVGVGVGVGDGLGLASGLGLAVGVGLGIGSPGDGVGIGLGSGDGLGFGTGVGIAVGLGEGEGDGDGVWAGIGLSAGTVVGTVVVGAVAGFATSVPVAEGVVCRRLRAIPRDGVNEHLIVAPETGVSVSRFPRLTPRIEITVGAAVGSLPGIESATAV